MIGLEGVGYTYPHTGHKALDNVSLAIPPGSCVMVTGPSGSGKTTLCMAAAGILHHEYGGLKEGKVVIAGKDVTLYRDLRDLSREIGIVFDDAEAQLIFTTVEEEILSSLERRGLPPETIEERLASIMEMTHITALRDRAPHTLSGGQKQRVVLAATLALGNEILILDEPTSELDEHGTEGIVRILRDLKSRGKTIVLVEHKFGKVREIVDCLVVLENGRIRTIGDPAEVVRDPEIRRIVVPDYGGMRAAGMKPPEGPPVITVRNLTHRYGEIEALTDVDLEIRKGEFIAIVGENGSGKTTLIKHFNGLLRPTEGTVSVLGKDTAGAAITDLARNVGLVFQNPDHMFFADTVRDEMSFGLENLGVGNREGVIAAALSEVRLSHTLDLYPRWLSRGERQRLAIACVVAMKPPVIVLDEPTTGLDGRESREVMEVLKALQEKGHTILIVTHSRECAEGCADRIITMEHGRIIHDTGPRGCE